MRPCVASPLHAVNELDANQLNLKCTPLKTSFERTFVDYNQVSTIYILN